MPLKGNDKKLLWNNKIEPSWVKTYKFNLAPTGEESVILNTVGEYLFGVYAREVDWLIKRGGLPVKTEIGGWKRRLTSELGARWANSIMNTARAQYNLAVRSLRDHEASLKRRIDLSRELLDKGELVTTKKNGKRRKPLSPREHFKVSRRLRELERELESITLTICLGGARLQRQDPEAWLLKRFFLQAQGETGKVGGNETLSLRDGFMRINVPKALKDSLGDKVSIPVNLKGHVAGNVLVAVEERSPVTVSYERGQRGWRVIIQCRVKPVDLSPSRSRGRRVLGIDLNAGHLNVAILDGSGNPVGLLCTHSLMT